MNARDTTTHFCHFQSRKKDGKTPQHLTVAPTSKYWAVSLFQMAWKTEGHFSACKKHKHARKPFGKQREAEVLQLQQTTVSLPL